MTARVYLPGRVRLLGDWPFKSGQTPPGSAPFLEGPAGLDENPRHDIRHPIRFVRPSLGRALIFLSLEQKPMNDTGAPLSPEVLFGAVMRAYRKGGLRETAA